MNYKKTLNNIHDKSYKSLYSNKTVFLDLLQNMINADWSKKLTIDNITLSTKSYILPDFEEQESDIVYKANLNDKEVVFYVLLEFQSTIDYRMPLRLFFYMSELLREYYKNLPNKAKSNKKGFSIPAIVPIVLYNGDRVWDVPLNFREIVQSNELFSDNIINFKYDLFDINHEYTKDELIQKNTMTSAIFLLDQKVCVKEFYERIKDIVIYFDSLTLNERSILKYWLKNTLKEEVAEPVIEILDSKKQEVSKMVFANAFIFDEEKERAKKQGRQEGLNEGRQEGRQEERINMLITLLSKKFTNLPQEYIDKITSLSQNKITAILNDIFDIDSLTSLNKYL